jgi:hypothetical protein
MMGIASEAKFDIFNEKNERILHAVESDNQVSFSIDINNVYFIASTFWQRFCCTTRRRFTLRILDNNNQVNPIHSKVMK